MITGYNTDVRHLDAVFHVQTEDKGTENPFIESLVYVGGQVLAAKRASYADLLATGQDQHSVVELMERQHRTVIAAIKSGRFDSKLQALLDSRKSQAVAAGAALSAEEAAAVADTDRTLDQVILEYLTSEADQDQLVLLVDGEEEVKLGAGAELSVRTSSSKSGRPVAGARVQVRMISTVSDPRILASGETDDEGGLELTFDVPKLDRGTAALIISAASALGDAEIKHLL